jgi:hypothetical protein
MVTPDRIRLRGLLRKSPAFAGLFYPRGPDDSKRVHHQCITGASRDSGAASDRAWKTNSLVCLTPWLSQNCDRFASAVGAQKGVCLLRIKRLNTFDPVFVRARASRASSSSSSPCWAEPLEYPRASRTGRLMALQHAGRSAIEHVPRVAPIDVLEVRRTAPKAEWPTPDVLQSDLVALRSSRSSTRSTACGRRRRSDRSTTRSRPTTGNEIWSALDNQRWPALHFVDADGIIRDHHFGEGR